MGSRAKIFAFEAPGLILKTRRDRFTVTYGEVMTVERARSGRLILHRRTGEAVKLACSAEDRASVENALRDRGVRIVDEFGAIIAPSLQDFEAELAREPVRLRQSSDDA